MNAREALKQVELQRFSNRSQDVSIRTKRLVADIQYGDILHDVIHGINYEPTRWERIKARVFGRAA